MEESRRVEQMLKKLGEFLTATELEKLAQTYLTMSSKLMLNSNRSNEGNNFRSGDEKSMILGNLINLARPGMGTLHENWILDSGASKHVTGISSEFVSYNPFPPTRKETIQTADGTAQPIRGSTFIPDSTGGGGQWDGQLPFGWTAHWETEE